jgi:hypothetical protein
VLRVWAGDFAVGGGAVKHAGVVEDLTDLDSRCHQFGWRGVDVGACEM